MAPKAYTIVPEDDGSGMVQKERDSNVRGSETRSRLTLQLTTLASMIVLSLNVTIAVYFGVSNGFRIGSSTILYQGDCTKTARLSTWSHIAINIFSTILLSGSNNAQQHLSAPTRAEIDRAHAAKEWLDIGIPSIRNVFSSRIGARRRILWLLLALTSIPLHWVYNSAVFESLSAEEYSVLVVTPEFIQGTNPGFVDPIQITYTWGQDFRDISATNESVANIRKVMGTFERLSPSECVTAYAQQVVSSRRDLVVVVNGADYIVKYCPEGPYSYLGCYYANPNVTNSLLQTYSSEYRQWGVAANSYDWMCFNSDGYWTGCNGLADVNGMKSTWILVDYEVDYCLSERVQEECTFQMSVSVMLIVCVCNALKLACLVLTQLWVRDTPLLTIGDAIASFMQRSDPNTANMALVPRSDFDDKKKWKPKSVRYNGYSTRYFASASLWKWLVCNFLYAAGIGTIAGLLNLAIRSTLSTWQMIREDGFGKIIPGNILDLTSTFTGSVLLANLPQMILSSIYLTYNALATSMSLTREYVSYSILNKRNTKANMPASLRVSNPTEGSSQRRAYYLQLPFRFAIGLMAGSAILHWLTSQSLFLAKVDIYRSIDTHTSTETQVLDASACMDTTGFSILPMICALVVAGTMTLILNGLAFVRVPGDMPLAASCSAAIAAACHGNGRGLGPVTWGVVDEFGGHLMGSVQPDDQFSGSGKLGFVDSVAGRPVPGQFYS